jgi:hypothetical protein
MPRTTAIRLLFAILAIGFFATPIAARTIGITAQSFENRRFAQAPKLSQGWNAFQQTTQYLTDRMPLRAQAIHANTHIWTNILKTDPRYTDAPLAGDEALPFAGTIQQNDPAPQDEGDGSALRSAVRVSALSGRDGWIYVRGEMDKACTYPELNRSLLRGWGNLIRAVKAGGRDAALFVAPYKASVYPEYLPDKYPFDFCALDDKERMWRMLSRDGPPLGVYELRSELLDLKERAGDGLFMRKDSHWSTLGALVLVRAALDQLGGGIQPEPSEVVYRGTVPYTGNLTLVRGREETDKTAEYDVVRDRDASRVPGRTLLLCDSFAYKWLRLFEPYFEDIRHVDWYQDDHTILEAIRRSDRVIVEATEFSVQVESEQVASIVQQLRAGG